MRINILLVLVCALSFSACNNPDGFVKARIVMDKQPPEGTICKLYVDNEFIGNVPVIEGFNGTTGSLDAALSCNIKNGKHKVVVKDANDKDLSVVDLDIDVDIDRKNNYGGAVNSQVTKTKFNVSTVAYSPHGGYNFKSILKSDTLLLILQY